MTETDILRAFESLGDNCEFGLVQSSVAVEQLGFFRFNSVSTDALLRTVESGFADFENFAGPEIEVACNDELIVHIPAYGFRYHTFYSRGDVDMDRLRRQQAKVVRFLARKFREDLRAGEKIFLRKSATASFEEIARLGKALRRYGDVTLLWVTLAEGERRPGEVEAIAPGLLKGYIDRFSEYKDATASSFAWFDMCRAAHARWRGVEVAERHRNDAIVNRLYRIRALADLACGSIVDEQGAHQCAILENAIVHGKQGIVTVDDAVVAETLAESTEGAHAALAEAPVTPLVAAAYHLFAGVGDDEEGRFRAVKARFEHCLYEQFTKQATGNNPAILLVPDMKGFQILNALRQLAPRHVPRLAIPPVRAVRVQRLCVPWPRHD